MEVYLDSSILSEKDYRKYLDLVGRPIQNQIKKAAKQIKSTKADLGNDLLKGGVIILNSGYSSLPHETFITLCERYIAKDTSQRLMRIRKK